MNIKKYSFIVAISLFLPTKLNLYGSDLGILQEKLGDDSYTEVYKRVVFCNASCASLLSNIKKDGTREVYYILRVIKELSNENALCSDKAGRSSTRTALFYTNLVAHIFGGHFLDVFFAHDSGSYNNEQYGAWRIHTEKRNPLFMSYFISNFTNAFLLLLNDIKYRSQKASVTIELPKSTKEEGKITVDGFHKYFSFVDDEGKICTKIVISFLPNDDLLQIPHRTLYHVHRVLNEEIHDKYNELKDQAISLYRTKERGSMERRLSDSLSAFTIQKANKDIKKTGIFIYETAQKLLKKSGEGSTEKMFLDNVLLAFEPEKLDVMTYTIEQSSSNTSTISSTIITTLTPEIFSNISVEDSDNESNSEEEGSYKPHLSSLSASSTGSSSAFPLLSLPRLRNIENSPDHPLLTGNFSLNVEEPDHQALKIALERLLDHISQEGTIEENIHRFIKGMSPLQSASSSSSNSIFSSGYSLNNMIVSLKKLGEQYTVYVNVFLPLISKINQKLQRRYEIKNPTTQATFLANVLENFSKPRIRDTTEEKQKEKKKEKLLLLPVDANIDNSTTSSQALLPTSTVPDTTKAKDNHLKSLDRSSS